MDLTDKNKAASSSRSMDMPPVQITDKDRYGVIEFVDPATLPSSSGGGVRMPVAVPVTKLPAVAGVAAAAEDASAANRSARSAQASRRKKREAGFMATSTDVAEPKGLSEGSEEVFAENLEETETAEAAGASTGGRMRLGVILMMVMMMAVAALTAFSFASDAAPIIISPASNGSLVSVDSDGYKMRMGINWLPPPSGDALDIAQAAARDALRTVVDMVAFTVWTLASPLVYWTLDESISDMGLSKLSGNVLDLSAGPASNIAYLDPYRIGSITFLERNVISHAYLSSAIRNAAATADAMPESSIRKMDLAQMSLASTEFPPESFDAIYGIFTICTLPTQESRIEALNKIHRWLKPGGVFVFMEPDAAREGTFSRRVQKLVGPAARAVSQSAIQVGAASSAGCDPTIDIAAVFAASSRRTNDPSNRHGWNFDVFEEVDSVVPAVWGRAYKPRYAPKYLAIADRVIRSVFDFFSWLFGMD